MKKNILRTVALLLTLLLLSLPLAACSSKGKTLLTLNQDGIKVTFSQNEYLLMLTRVKGTLASYQFQVNSDSFWGQQDKYNGTDLQTLDAYYKDSVLDNCRNYLVALYLFEKEGLSLSDASLTKVDELMDELVQTDGDGSKTKLNSILSAYGANYNILKDLYLMQEKVTALQDHLYGKNAELLGDVVKAEYLAANYVHFEQIFFPSYTYVYKTDKNGDVIYYRVDENGNLKKNIFYDSGNGVAAKDEKGEPILDDNGEQVYYVKDNPGKIAYDIYHGKPSHKLSSDGKSYETEEMTKEELATLKADTEKLFDTLKDSTYAEFEEEMKKNAEEEVDPGAEKYTDGYYLKVGMDYSASGEETAYLDDIVEALTKGEDGAVYLVQSVYGFHIIKEYPHTEKAYELEGNESWFSDFHSGLIQKYFIELCRTYYGSIEINDKVYASMPPMKEIGVNYYY